VVLLTAVLAAHIGQKLGTWFGWARGRGRGVGHQYDGDCHQWGGDDYGGDWMTWDGDWHRWEYVGVSVGVVRICR